MNGLIFIEYFLMDNELIIKTNHGSAKSEAI